MTIEKWAHSEIATSAECSRDKQRDQERSALVSRLVAIATLVVTLLIAGCRTVSTGETAAAHGVRGTARVALGPGVRDVGLLVEPDDGMGDITRAIRNANNSIWLTMYLLTNHTIVHDLEYAHGYGVDVRVILEPHPYGATDNTNLAAYNSLMAADIPVRWASPRFLLTHEKCMLVDGTTAYIMTTNFTRAAFQTNREFDVVDRDPPDVAAARALFDADWNGRPYAPRDPNLPISPSDARPLLGDLIASARHSIEVYGEELQDTGMEQALGAAARRGVQVRLILPAPSGLDRDAPGIALVTASGVQVRRLPQSYLYVHAKAIVVDGRRAFVGSQNLSTASLDGNRELGVIVADRNAIGRIENTFEGDWRQAAP